MRFSNAAERTARPATGAGVVRIVAILMAVSSVSTAATLDLRKQSASVAANDVNLDLRNDALELTGNVHLTSGGNSLSADRATASALQSDHSRWSFTNSVHISTPEAELRSLSASASFANDQLAEARVTGAPAQFERRNMPPDKQVRGRANVIEYDFSAGIVTLSDQVWFSYGGNEVSGEKVIYNLREERVQVNPEGSSRGRVRAVIRPGTGTIEDRGGKDDPAARPKAGDGA